MIDGTPGPQTVLRVGLTGNIGAGKSTVAAWLTDLGCAVIDLDALGHDCLQPGTPTYDEVLEIFGAAILDADGRIDRRALGAIVFASAESRRRLEEVLHPAIREREERCAAEIADAGGARIIVSEAALLFETGAAERYQRMVVVTAPDAVRRARLQSRGLGKADATRRMGTQMDQSRKAALADYVIDNSGSLDAAHAATRDLVELLRHDLERHAAGKPLHNRRA